MYKNIGKIGCVNLRSISYVEDIEDDNCFGYKFGFDIEILPSIKVSNHKSRISICFRWINWELLWFKYRKSK